MGCDLAVISGTVRQLELYEHLGFQRFGPVVGAGNAQYQPMYLTLDRWYRTKSLAGVAEPPAMARFLPGPVAVSEAVRREFVAEPVSHRSREFMARMARVKRNLCELAGAPHACVLVGSGTLANDAIAAQIRSRGDRGLVLANGEFGERLHAHARGWGLPHEVVRVPWGQSFDWDELHRHAQSARPCWVWAVLSETSTGMLNSVVRLRELCERTGADLCLDAISAVGLVPVDLQGTWLASTVSGKGLAAYTGLSIVFHDGRIAPAGALPRYVDLAAYEESAGVPYSQSSNLVAALDCALASTSWPARFQRVAAIDRELRAALADCDLAPLVHHDVGTPGILTVPLPPDIDAVRIARAMQADGIVLACESEYLRHRNWLQICLMGECDVAGVRRIPGRLDMHVHHRAPRSARGGLAQSLHG
jgi:aspartate aminotransferase-like enzyme